MTTKFYCFSAGEYVDLTAETKPQVIKRLLDERRDRGTSEEVLELWFEWYQAAPWQPEHV